MPTINDGALHLEMAEASEAQRRLGLAAALAVLDAAPVDDGKGFERRHCPEARRVPPPDSGPHGQVAPARLAA